MSSSSPLPPSPLDDGFDHRGPLADHVDRLRARFGSRWPDPARRTTAVLAAGALSLVLLAAVVVLLLLGRPGAGRPTAPPVSLPLAAGAGGRGDGATATTTAEVVVQAAGAVLHPGVFHLPGGGRVGDLVAAAGGLTPDADPDRINLAASLTDGARIYVLRRGEGAPEPPVDGGGADGPAGTSPAAPVDLNAATVDQLDALPGVGPATAAAIVAERRLHGPFRSVDDLARVRGIGPAKLAALRARVRV